MPKMYFRNVRTQTRYEVISLDRETGVIRLRGAYSIFKEHYTKERFKAMGYVLEKGDDDAE